MKVLTSGLKSIRSVFPNHSRHHGFALNLLIGIETIETNFQTVSRQNKSPNDSYSFPQAHLYFV